MRLNPCAGGTVGDKAGSTIKTMAVVFSGQLTCCSGLLHFGPSKLQCHIRRHNKMELNSSNAFQLASNAIPIGKIRYVRGTRASCTYASAAGKKHHQWSFDDAQPYEPFWLSLVRDAVWSLKSLSEFLVEQPSQLRHIEWPSFQNTFRTATLSLILVAVFIVVLSAVDSALCYILSLFLRRTP